MRSDFSLKNKNNVVHGDLPRQHSFGTTLRFAGPVHKLGTDPMAYGGFK